MNTDQENVALNSSGAEGRVRLRETASKISPFAHPLACSGVGIRVGRAGARGGDFGQGVCENVGVGGGE